MRLRFEYVVRSEYKFNHHIVKAWLLDIGRLEGRQLGNIQIVITSDAHLLKINQKFLKHDYLTDVITFDDNVKDIASGEILISQDRAIANANDYQESPKKEVFRLIVHGVLHLMGYHDQSPDEKEEMRKLEERYLSVGINSHNLILSGYV